MGKVSSGSIFRGASESESESESEAFVLPPFLVPLPSSFVSGGRGPHTGGGTPTLTYINHVCSTAAMCRPAAKHHNGGC